MPKRYYSTSEGKLVRENNPNALFQVHVEGQEVDDQYLAARYGAALVKELHAALKKGEEPAEEAVPEPEPADLVETKAVSTDEVEDKEATRPRRGG